ncbi:MAG TPA: sensor histidine kinase [Marmoricola sp.]|nr:sensor histidine kinase [Marmoricola sp.]
MTRRSWAFDVTVVAVVLVLGQLEAWYGINATHRQGPHWAEAVAFGIGALALLGRRVRPLGCLVVLVTAYLVEFAVFGSPQGNAVAMAPMVAFYSVGRYHEQHAARWALVAFVVLGAGWIGLDPLNDGPADWLAGTAWLSLWLVAWLAGALVRSRLQNAEQRRAEQTERAARAVAEERNRIARELHDVIGHSVSVMTVQASAVRRRLGPEQLVERQALETVEAVGREALGEMRRMVGVLRQGDDPADREPPPGLSELGRLVQKFRTAGLPVELTVSGPAKPLAPGLDLTAYRLVQEGLTNTLRHAGSPSCAEVSIAYAEECLRLAVRDDGQPAAVPAEGGHGLLGMRERVSVYGGELVAGPRAGGGFELLVTLPLGTP